MKRTIKRASIFLLLLPVVLSCEMLFFEDDLATTDPYENFDYLWTQVDEKYSFFELKGIDWDSAKTAYRGRLNEKMSGDSLFRVMGDMLTELRDDHTNLITSFNRSFYGVRNRTPDNYDPRIVQDNYLPLDYYVTGPFNHDFIRGENIGYVRFSSFTGGVGDGNMSFILRRYQEAEGLIFDLRENGGGAVKDVYELLGRFIDEKTHTINSRIKDGPGHNDFTEWKQVFVEPAGRIKYTDKPVVFLVDRGSYSAASYTAIQTKAIPNIVLMGDTTGGGLGLPNGGELPNGWEYRFSVTQTAPAGDPGNISFENGVPPDVVVYLDRSDTSTDEVIEAAIQNIKSRQ